ncbi:MULTISPECIES: PAS domain S-box protein [Myxococcaceae]|uniref:PAS domain S-box protein n=1 Tax=Myxococcaceae TaxID=31 RepID=UPI00188EC346|nr:MULTISPECIES: PAS domain S-box protein [Myxococcaceae]MBF5046252.1 PAS domain S-box protein [Simulacricoccus sp. 17bor-14]
MSSRTPVLLPGALPPSAQSSGPAAPAETSLPALFVAAFESSPVGMSICSLEGELLRVNPAYREMFGLSEEEVRGQHFRTRVHPEDRYQAMWAHAELVSGRQRAVKYERRSLHRDGREVWTEVSASLVLGPAGEPLHVLSHLMDVSERRQRQQALLDAEERLRMLGRATKDLVWDWDIPSGELRWNEAMQTMLGYSPHEVQPSLAWWEAQLHPDDLARVLASLDRALQGEGHAWVDEYRFRRADGSYAAVLDRGYFLRDAQGQAVRGIGAMMDLSERRAAEERLRKSEEYFRALIENARDLVAVLDAQGRFAYVSPAVTRVLGFSSEQMVGHRGFDFVHPEDLSAVRARLEECSRAPGNAVTVEYRARHRDGSWRTLETYWWNQTHHPAMAGFVVNARDVTQQRALEEQFRQAQKMEAVGRLAGGVAHDFNNLLTIITAHTDFAREEVAAGSQAREDLAVVADTAQRAVRLTRQLLAFSRRQVLQPALLDLNEKVRGLEGMLRRLLSEDIVLATELARTPSRVWADPGQVDQVLMNLVVNARDAMPHGGLLGVETSEVALAQGNAAGLPAGPYVVLSVRDTGIGMDAATRARLFEPFFTTKAAGKGTGLGLSTVYGIVQQSGGALEVESSPGAGSTFRVLLPRAPAAPQGTEDEADGAHPAPGGHETVLVVEDEAPVRGAACRILERQGYRVLEAKHGADALQVLAAHDGPVHLVLTDVVMPEMGGAELVRELRARGVPARVLFMSGYSEEAVATRGVLVEGVGLLEKPFDLQVLLRRVREVLDA